MSTYLLKLKLLEPVVFSVRGATEGDHAALDYLPATALLGWAARKYDDFGDEAFDVFHSGKIKFSNGYIASSDRLSHLQAAFPVPQILTQPKHRKSGFIEDKDRQKSLSEEVYVGQPSADRNRDNLQYDAMRGFYVSDDGTVFEPKLKRRLKTAIDNGRAKQGSLFGYAYLEAGQHFLATVEIDDTLTIAKEKLKACFGYERKTTLLLGRSRKTEFGGHVECEMQNLEETLRPKCSAGHQNELCLWLLSDLAINDRRTGQPTTKPSLTDLFEMTSNAKLDARKSSIQTRRYAPWNKYLGVRDIERVVISGGSVLVYSGIDCEELQDIPERIGLYQEAGLGQIAMNPEFLSGEKPKFSSVSTFTIAKPPPSEPMDEDKRILDWMQNRIKITDTTKRDDWAKEAKEELRKLYTSARRTGKPDAGPSRSQWGDVLAELKKHRTKSCFKITIFDGDSALIELTADNQAGQSQTIFDDWRAVGFIGEDRKEFHEWFKEQIDSPMLDDIHFYKGVSLLITHGMQLANNHGMQLANNTEKQEAPVNG